MKEGTAKTTEGARVDGKFQRSSSFRAARFLQQLILILWGVCSIISTFGWFVLVHGPLPFDSWMIKSLWAPESARLGHLRSDGATSLPWRGQSKWRAAATSFGFYLMCVCVCTRGCVFVKCDCV